MFGKLQDGTHLLIITGRMKGDQFPAAEAFVEVHGVKVFLGVSPARYDPQFAGPFTALFGDRQANMARLAAQLIVNHSGEVMGVVQNGRKLDVDRYNQAFVNTRPVNLDINRQQQSEALRQSGALNRGAAWWNK